MCAYMALRLQHQHCSAEQYYNHNIILSGKKERTPEK